MNKSLEADIHELLEVLKHPENPEYREAENIFALIFSFMDEDFSPEELEKAVHRFFLLLKQNKPIALLC